MPKFLRFFKKKRGKKTSKGQYGEIASCGSSKGSADLPDKPLNSVFTDVDAQGDRKAIQSVCDAFGASGTVDVKGATRPESTLEWVNRGTECITADAVITEQITTTIDAIAAANKEDADEACKTCQSQNGQSLVLLGQNGSFVAFQHHDDNFEDREPEGQSLDTEESVSCREDVGHDRSTSRSNDPRLEPEGSNHSLSQDESKPSLEQLTCDNSRTESCSTTVPCDAPGIIVRDLNKGEDCVSNEIVTEDEVSAHPEDISSHGSLIEPCRTRVDVERVNKEIHDDQEDTVEGSTGSLDETSGTGDAETCIPSISATCELFQHKIGELEPESRHSFDLQACYEPLIDEVETFNEDHHPISLHDNVHQCEPIPENESEESSSLGDSPHALPSQNELSPPSSPQRKEDFTPGLPWVASEEIKSDSSTDDSGLNSSDLVHEIEVGPDDEETKHPLLWSYYCGIQKIYNMEDIERFIVDFEVDEYGFPILAWPSREIAEIAAVIVLSRQTASTISAVSADSYLDDQSIPYTIEVGRGSIHSDNIRSVDSLVDMYEPEMRNIALKGEEQIKHKVDESVHCVGEIQSIVCDSTGEHGKDEASEASEINSAGDWPKRSRGIDLQNPPLSFASEDDGTHTFELLETLSKEEKFTAVIDVSTKVSTGIPEKNPEVEMCTTSTDVSTKARKLAQRLEKLKGGSSSHSLAPEAFWRELRYVLSQKKGSVSPPGDSERTPRAMREQQFSLPVGSLINLFESNARGKVKGAPSMASMCDWSGAVTTIETAGVDECREDSSMDGGTVLTSTKTNNEYQASLRLWRHGRVSFQGTSKSLYCIEEEDESLRDESTGNSSGEGRQTYGTQRGELIPIENFYSDDGSQSQQSVFSKGGRVGILPLVDEQQQQQLEMLNHNVAVMSDTVYSRSRHGLKSYNQGYQRREDVSISEMSFDVASYNDIPYRVRSPPTIEEIGTDSESRLLDTCLAEVFESKEHAQMDEHEICESSRVDREADENPLSSHPPNKMGIVADMTSDQEADDKVSTATPQRGLGLYSLYTASPVELEQPHPYKREVEPLIALDDSASTVKTSNKSSKKGVQKKSLQFQRLLKSFDKTFGHHEEKVAASSSVQEHSLRSVSHRTRSYLTAPDDELLMMSANIDIPSDEEDLPSDEETSRRDIHPEPREVQSCDDIAIYMPASGNSQERKILAIESKDEKTGETKSIESPTPQGVPETVGSTLSSKTSGSSSQEINTTSTQDTERTGNKMEKPPPPPPPRKPKSQPSTLASRSSRSRSRATALRRKKSQSPCTVEESSSSDESYYSEESLLYDFDFNSQDSDDSSTGPSDEDESDSDSEYQSLPRRRRDRRDDHSRRSRRCDDRDSRMNRQAPKGNERTRPPVMPFPKHTRPLRSALKNALGSKSSSFDSNKDGKTNRYGLGDAPKVSFPDLEINSSEVSLGETEQLSHLPPIARYRRDRFRRDHTKKSPLKYAC